MEEAQLINALDFGGLAVLRNAWQRLGLSDLFADIKTSHASRLQAMIFARLLFPSSKLALAEEAAGTVLAQACDLPPDEAFDEDDLYEAMDQLNGRWTPLVKSLYGKAFPNSVRIALYDITSVYFEGKGPKGLARYGHSRDHRQDRPQVNLAVVTDETGVPISVSILRGNRADNKTLLSLLKLLKRRFGITQATFVFDGGMSGSVNLKGMTEAGLHYVTRLSSATMGALLAASVDACEQMRQMELGDKTRLIEIEYDGMRCVLAGGAWRAQRDAERRNARVAKGEAVLRDLAAKRRKSVNAQKLASTVGRALERVKAHKYFDYEVDGSGTIQWHRKTEVLEAEQDQDGWYVLHTNHTAEACSKESTHGHYKGLLEVEDAFRELKTYLEIRPVRHHRPDRVVNHIRICFIAYWISARLGREWQQAGSHREVVRILRGLQKIRIGTLRFEGQHLRTLMTALPKDIEQTIGDLNLGSLFSAPPNWIKPTL